MHHSLLGNGSPYKKAAVFSPQSAFVSSPVPLLSNIRPGNVRRSLALRFKRGDVLIAGPYFGELGFELMRWQGYVRALRKRFKQTYVITFPGREILYEGCHVLAHDADLKRTGYGYGHVPSSVRADMVRRIAGRAKIDRYELFDTDMLSTPFLRKVLWQQEWVAFVKDDPDVPALDWIFHFRSIVKDGPDSRSNFPTHEADRLVQLARARGLRVACIGHPMFSYCPPNAVDLRDYPLGRAVAAFNKANLVVGQLSGPMHLASLCRKPIVIWADGGWRIASCRRWNPFNMPIHVVTETSFSPTAEAVFKAALAADQTIHTAFKP